MPLHYDVFLSHSSLDKPEIERIAYKLREAGFVPFLDKWHLVPGEPWQEALEEALDQSATCAVFIGPGGLSPWQNEEMSTALEERVRNRSFRVIPVLLPGSKRPERSELPRFLRRLTWVDFSSRVDDVRALRLLACGIRGEAPGPSREIARSSIALPSSGAGEGLAANTGSALAATRKSETGWRASRSRKFFMPLAALLVAGGSLSYLWHSQWSGGDRMAIDSIAVLPLVNVDGDPDGEYIADGITEHLINSLSEHPQIRVIAQYSAFSYKGKEIDPKEVSRTLGVRAVMSGSVLKRGQNLVLRAELIDGRDSTQLWGKRYQRPIGSIQSIESDVVRDLSAKLRLATVDHGSEGIATEASEAYRLYLQGLSCQRKGGGENIRKALELYEKARAIDPDFALAYSGLAQVHYIFAQNSWSEPREALARAGAAAEKALELDDSLAEPHIVKAHIKESLWDWSGAEASHRKAIELSPNLATAHEHYAWYLSHLGRQKEAMIEIKLAQRLDPLSTSSRCREASILENARRDTEAIRVLRDVLKLEPDNRMALLYLGYAYSNQGLYSEAIAQYRKIFILPWSTSLRAYMGYAYAMSGNRREALAILQELNDTTDYVSKAELAILQVGLGDNEGAILSLEQAYREHDLQLMFLPTEQHYDRLRSDPRFKDLIRRMGLPPGVTPIRTTSLIRPLALGPDKELLGQRDDDARRASHVAESVLVLVLGHFADELGTVGAQASDSVVDLAAAAVPLAAEPFSFVVVGDTTYSPSADYPLYEKLIAAINGVSPVFTIHVGDTKGRGDCGRAFQESRARPVGAREGRI